LFGDLPQVMDVPPPKIPTCEPWSLTDKLHHEKEITGMYLSGHPLDHYRFELQHYNILNVENFVEIKDSNTLSQASLLKPLRLAGLVVDAQHRVTKTGRNFGILGFEDFSGKAEIALWSDDYVKYQNYLEKGKNILVQGFFKQNWKGDGYEFKVTSINLLETAKQMLTKQVELNIHPSMVSKEFIKFIEKNLKENPGKAALKFNVVHPEENIKISLVNNQKSFTMNDDMSSYIVDNAIEVKVELN
jgi:DNA polymerase-3 subunit alpha